VLTIISVLRSGGIYKAEWVRKLRDACARHMSLPHRFVCLSDVEVLCERIPMIHGWPGWWAKIELFKPGVIRGPTLYLDLDTVLVGSIDALAYLPHDFAVMRNFHRPEMPGSAVMWFREAAPTEVYERFRAQPEALIREYAAKAAGAYVGDQAFLWDVLNREIPLFDSPLIRSYKKHCQNGVPKGAALVAFGGPRKPSTVDDPWVRKAWA
jgi:hypothetical protein